MSSKDNKILGYMKSAKTHVMKPNKQASLKRIQGHLKLLKLNYNPHETIIYGFF